MVASLKKQTGVEPNEFLCDSQQGTRAGQVLFLEARLDDCGIGSRLFDWNDGGLNGLLIFSEHHHVEKLFDSNLIFWRH